MKVKYLTDLTADFMVVLKAANYRPACIRKMIQSWDHLDRYMVKLDITTYSRTVGDAHIRERFGDMPYTDYKKSSKDRIRYIEILSDYLEKRILSGNRLKVSPVTFPGQLGVPFDGFIEYARNIKSSGLSRPYSVIRSVSTLPDGFVKEIEFSPSCFHS